MAPVVRDDPAVETPSLQLQLGPRVAQFGVTTDFASMHGQEDVPTLPFVQEAEGLASKKPSQTSRSVWSKLFVSKPQTFFPSSMLESSVSAATSLQLRRFQ